MAERKVLNKYYPPDFDPSKLIRPKKPVTTPNQSTGGYVVRMMLPMSVRCNTCGEYLYIGTKFNMRKENLNEYYLGIQIFRFYFKCTRCSAEITMKTDPKNSDYICERGASRNYEAYRDMESAVVEFKKKRLEEEEGDAMKTLENRTFDSKKEMDILDALNEVKLQNRRHANPDMDKMLEMVSTNKALELDNSDQEKIKNFRKRKVAEDPASDSEDPLQKHMENVEKTENLKEEIKKPLVEPEKKQEKSKSDDEKSDNEFQKPVKKPIMPTLTGLKLPFKLNIIF